MIRSASPRLPVLASVFVIGLLACGCATVGHDFPSEKVQAIRLNQTTQAEVEAMFGPPWRTGMEEGMVTWTYGRYRYAIFSDAKTKDLVLRFNDQNVVVSYSFNTTEHEYR